MFSCTLSRKQFHPDNQAEIFHIMNTRNIRPANNQASLVTRLI